MEQYATFQGDELLYTADKHPKLYKIRVVKLAVEVCLIVGQLHYKCILNANEKFACRS